MRKPLRHTIPLLVGSTLAVGLFGGCQSTRSTDPEPTGPMTAYAAFNITAGDFSRIPDSSDWTAGKQNGTGRLGCIGFACTDTLTLSNALGSDTARIRLHKLGVQIATFFYTQSARSPNLILAGTSSKNEANLKLLGSFYELRESKIDSFAKFGSLTPQHLVDYYAALVYSKAAGYGAFPDSLPVGMNADSVRIDLVRLAVASKSSWVHLAATKWGLDSTSIHAISLKLLDAGLLVPADTLTLFPLPPVRVLQSISLAKAVTRGGPPVGVSGLFSWDKGSTPVPAFEVRTRSGLDTSHFHFPTLRYLPTDTSWSLTGNLTLQVDREATPGIDTLVITLADGKGNRAVAKTVFEVASGDTARPSIRFESPSKDSLLVETSTELFRLVAVASDSSGIDSIRIGNKTSTGARCTSLVELALGSNTFTARAWDGYKNTDSVTVTIVRQKKAHSDSIKPAIERLAPRSDDSAVAWNTQTMAMAWKVSDDSGVAKVLLDDSILSAGTDGIYRKSIPLVVGNNTVVLTAFDVRGNVGRDTVRLERKADTTKPVVGLATPSRDMSVDNAVQSLLVKVSASDAESGIDSVKIGSKVVKATPYEANVDLAVGENTVSVQAWDKAGNASATISVKITRAALGDTTRPTIVRSAPNASDTTVDWGATSMTLVWTVADDSSLAKVLFEDSTLTGVGGVYQIAIGLPVGAKTYTLTALDARGNSRKDTVRVVRLADVSKPVAARGATTRDTVLPASATSLAVLWNVSDNALKSVMIEGEAVAGASGIFSRTVALTGSDTYIGMVALDASDNRTSDSIRVRRLGAPTIAPPGGFVDVGSVSVSLASALAVDSMQYSFDKTVWSKWKGASIVVGSSKIVYVRSLLGTLTSAVDSELYLFPPSMSLATGAYTGTQTLTISAPGAGIEVSTNNGATWSSYSLPLTVSTSASIKARSTLGVLVSAPVSITMAIAPVLSPASKDDTLDTLRVVAAAAGSDSIQLSIDSLTWTKANSHLLSASGKLFTRAWKDGVVSPVVVGNYTFRCAAPRLWPSAGSFGSPQYLVLSTRTIGAFIQYSLDGGETWKDYQVGSPVAVALPKTTLSVRVVKSGFLTAASQAEYHISNSNWGGFHPAYDTVRDSRTGQTYRKIRIGGQTWMAENLNFPTDSSSTNGSALDSAGKYGRYYQWSAAMGLDPAYNTAKANVIFPHRGLCPTGWHVPSRVEYDSLRANATESEIKSIDGWTFDPDYPENGYGSNVSGFNLLPAGITRTPPGFFSRVGTWAVFWTASEFNGTDTETAVFESWTNGTGDGPQDDKNAKTYRYPIRCLAD